MDIQDKYLPDLEARRKFIETQIEETKRIIFRSTIDLKEGEFRHQDNLVAESQFNIKQLITKIDILTEELDNLGE